jgi:hypothetical protein
MKIIMHALLMSSNIDAHLSMPKSKGCGLMVTCPALRQYWIECKVVDVTGGCVLVLDDASKLLVGSSVWPHASDCWTFGTGPICRLERQARSSADGAMDTADVLRDGGAATRRVPMLCTIRS